MKDKILKVLNEYLLIFPNENERQSRFKNYIENHSYSELVDWNNFDGHLVAGGFIFSKKEKKFLVLYHKDLEMFLYPGGHVTIEDNNVLEAAKREIIEETGLENIKELKISENEMVPIDIDTQIIKANERLNLPAHLHFDFRYLFVVDNISDIAIDTEELSEYKWINFNELKNEPHYGKITEKIDKLIKI